MSKKGRLFVLSGPSGVGKGTVLKNVLAECDDITFSVSATTRSPRLDEEEGKDYFFMSPEEFQGLIQEDAFLEWAQVHGHYYGTLKKTVADLLLAGKSVILDIDTQGAMKIQGQFSAVFIFLAPPSQEELKRRLVDRGTEDEKSLEIRLANAALEMKRLHRYDYLVINDRIHGAVCRLKAILLAERCRILKDQEEEPSWETR